MVHSLIIPLSFRTKWVKECVLQCAFVKVIDGYLIQVCLIFKGSSMALSFLLVLAATVILIRPETPVTKVGTRCSSAREPT